MASLQIISSSVLCSSSLKIKSSIQFPELPKLPSSYSYVPTRNLLQELNGFRFTIPPTFQQPPSSSSSSSSSNATQQLYAILEAVSDRVEMHLNLAHQRNNWNTLLFNNINMLTLTATAMAAIASATPISPLKISSTLLFSAATGMMLVVNKIQPSQLAEEQRNATRLFKQLQSQIETTIALGNPNDEDVKKAMKNVLAIDKAYPLPLLGVMIEKFPSKFEPAVWWPQQQHQQRLSSSSKRRRRSNGWNEELERELMDVLEVVKRKDMEDYERLGNMVLNINKSLAIAGPLLTGIAAVGSMFVSEGSSLAAMVTVMGGALATAVNALEHGGQVGMVCEMYRNCGGFFRLLEDSIEEAVEEEKEDGEVFEMKVALKLGRSVSELRQLASKSAYSRVEGIPIQHHDEFASKLF
ncbi:hypothetical protein PIB30_017571 [Stylosanthes scabra]|uniref:F-box protein n=1 Tax=Stylosanthes scabra TaxID=79078 RepID=A0ABU6T7H5_9FABA|nr:hypothetical protein [Stylosanthes scabra]